MTIHAVTHVALRVAELRKSEAFYSALWGLEVAWREAQLADGWATLPEGKTWDDAAAAGVELHLAMLHRGGLALALEAAPAVQPDGHLSHIGLHLDADAFREVRERLGRLGCRLIHESATTLVFDDPFGVRWEPTTLAYTDPKRFSTGARLGRWLTL